MSDVDIPKVGKVPKPALIAVGAVAVGFVGYRWYQSRQDAAASTTDTTTDPMDTTAIDPSTGLPYDAVDPATGLPYSSDSGSSYAPYGYDPVTGQPLSSDPGLNSGYGFTGTTDSQWSQYAAQQLQQSDTWSYTDIVTALGNYLGQRPLTALQQQIVQAAIAVAGNPPVGYYTIIPGGDTGITVAPTGLKAGTPTSTGVPLSWSAVSGASGYEVAYGATSVHVTGTSTTLSGLAPGTAYSITVAALSSSGAPGPASSAVSVKTAAAAGVTAPKDVKVRDATTTSFLVTWDGQLSAHGYYVYVNGKKSALLAGTDWIINSSHGVAVKANTSYSVYVTAVDSTGKESAHSSTVTVKTPKK